MTALQFIIGGLATYRLTVLIARDAGPYRIFAKLRENDRYSKLLKCPFCTSVWAGALVYLIQVLSGIDTELVLGLLFVLSYSAIAIALDRVFSADHLAK